MRTLTRGKLALAAVGLAALSAALSPTIVPAVSATTPMPISTCQTLSAPGAYRLTADLAAVDATCVAITASEVKLDLAGHTVSCTGSGFAGSCQVPTFASHGIQVAPGLTGVVVTGPGSITGFDNGVVISDGNALVSGITISAPACDPGDCLRPISNGILVLGESGVNLSHNDVSNYAFGLRLVSVQCPGDTCALIGNAVHDNNCGGINLGVAMDYTITRNVALSNGSISCFPTAGIALGDGSTGNVVINNDSSNNVSFGIGIGPGTNGNTIANNTARGNTVDLRAFPGTTNRWNDNNRCNTESGAVPSSVCNVSE